MWSCSGRSLSILSTPQASGILGIPQTSGVLARKA